MLTLVLTPAAAVAENDPAEVIDFANRAIQEFLSTASPPEVLGFKVGLADTVVNQCNMKYSINMRNLQREVNTLGDAGYDLSSNSAEHAIMEKAQGRAAAYGDLVLRNSALLNMPSDFYCSKFEAAAARFLRKTK